MATNVEITELSPAQSAALELLEEMAEEIRRGEAAPDRLIIIADGPKAGEFDMRTAIDTGYMQIALLNLALAYATSRVLAPANPRGGH